MATIRVIRIFFLLLSVVAGYYLAPLVLPEVKTAPLYGAGTGLLFAVLLMLMEIKLRRVSLRNLSAGVFGLIFGFFIAWMLTLILRLMPMADIYYVIFQIVFTLIFCYLGMTISIKGKDEFNLIIPYVRFSREDRREQFYLLDTSVIIDGRVAKLCETGFLEGKLVVPRFVLQELQQVADSADDSKRSRGRRGLDILNMLKKTPGVEVIVHDESLSEIKEVDAKLVRMAKILDCRVITNDFNLNKVAKLEGVTVLNMNDLANALRLVIFPGEEMHVMIKKEGKERNQGVAFMDDGTMIVVDNARRMMGRTVKVTVTSVLQTSAGRMIFANLIERPQEERYERSERHDRRPEERQHERHHDNRRPEERQQQERHQDNRRPEERHHEPQERHQDNRRPEERHERNDRRPEERHDRPERQESHEAHERPAEERQTPSQDQPQEGRDQNNG